MAYKYVDISKRSYKKFTDDERRELWKEIGQLLFEAREMSLSQEQVAQTGIVTQSVLSKIESGKRQIDIITLTELASLYDVDLEEVIPKLLKKCTHILNEK